MTKRLSEKESRVKTTAFYRSRNLCVLSAVLCIAVITVAQVPFPNAATPKAIDHGALTAQSATPISVTVALRLSAQSDAESLMKALYAPGNPLYHQFLTSDQFASRFAPASADVSKVVATLAKFGLSSQRTSTTTLRVTGMPADMERAFSVSLHSYQVPAQGNAKAYTFHAPLTAPTVPAEISASVAAVGGLDSRPRFHPMNHAAPQGLAMAPTRVASPAAATGNPPGQLTVTDFAAMYDVLPLYKRGDTGHGRTIGIMTLASFTPSDAYTYWQALGLKVSPHRIKVVDIDGGPGAPSDASGSVETTLDVEQSGGIAPGARIIVYQAPNTNQGFLDLFATAIDANRAQSLSLSWGSWEWFDNLENSPVSDPFSGETVGIAQAIHELLVQAAIQGQTTFTSSGDNGAYEANGDLGCFGPFSDADPSSCALTLSVDYPASDTAITAAGGTTLPGLQEYCLNSACTPPYFDVNIANEQVWGWDYLIGLCDVFGADPVSCGIFPGGTGGGVSFMFKRPFYQDGLAGLKRTERDQIFEVGGDFTTDGNPFEFDLPGHYRGRNVPDVSFNADPETGFVIVYTSDQSGFGVLTYWGGTSFVAPQLNGVSALLGQDLHSRIGLLNFPLYDLAQSGRAYRGPNAPLNAITDGDNWFYHGSKGYNPAVGLGTMDVANFARYLRNNF